MRTRNSEKRKTTFDEPSVELKLLQDLKSENGNMRGLLTSIVEHFDINPGRKRKGQDDVTKPGKSHAALANTNGLQGKSKKSTRKGAVSMPRHYLSRENSTKSESSGNESPVHNAMSRFARVQMDPMPKLSVQSIFGPKSCPALDTSKTRWDKDRFGYHNQRPKHLGTWTIEISGIS
jgi:hypothetical protein